MLFSPGNLFHGYLSIEKEHPSSGVFLRLEVKSDIAGMNRCRQVTMQRNELISCSVDGACTCLTA